MEIYLLKESRETENGRVDVEVRHRIQAGACGLERWTGDRTVEGSNPSADHFSLRNFGNFVYPALPQAQCLSEETTLETPSVYLVSICQGKY